MSNAVRRSTVRYEGELDMDVLEQRSPDDSWLAWLAPLAPCALSAMGELSSLTGDVGPAFPVVIPVGRAGTAVEEAVDAATTTTPAKVSEEGPEAEAAMWKALGDVVTTRLRLAADRVSKAGFGERRKNPHPPRIWKRCLGMGALPPVPVSGAGPGPWGTPPPLPPVVAPACCPPWWSVMPRRSTEALRSFFEGCYHGKVIFPSEYPHAPPAILMMTPSGRLETRKRLCLSMTDFHPESWNPAWSVETILVGLLSFFISEERGYGSMSASREERVRLARQSRRSNAEDELFRQLFPEYVERTEADSPETCGGSVTADAERPETAAERAEDAEDLEAANSRRPSVSEGSEGVAECWICRDPYQGSERVPGVRDFVSHNCRAGAAQCGRVLVLFGLLMLYQECAMDGNLLTPLRALGVTFVALVTIYRLWVLFVSLPQHRAPPQHWLLQRLFVPGQQELAKHLAEAMSFVTVLTVWVIAGLISWPFAVPYAVAAATLAAKLGLGRQAGWRCLPTRDCLVRSLRAALCILVSPLILIWATGEFLWTGLLVLGDV
eukprot:g13257.t1